MTRPARSRPHIRSRDTIIRDVFRRLFDAYGAQHWWPGDGPIEVIVGAILTQQTTWANVEKALANLKSEGLLSIVALRDVPEQRLALLIRPSGYYNAKAARVKSLVALADRHFGGDLNAMLSAPGDELRSLLLSTHGVGPETADSILLYAANRPHFVIDAYTRRIFSRIGVIPAGESYEDWQGMLTGALPSDAAVFNEYHALIVRHGKAVCRNRPLCAACPLLSLCATGRNERPAL